ncbi:MAG TPA: ester cyclase [Methylomirabilota bacterium]|nr:ester cyclase [Methylomirabilota bacterium]
MENEDLKQLYKKWVAIWNGDSSLIDTIIAPNFIFHREGGQPDWHGPEETRKMLAASRVPFSELTFHTTIGPIGENNLVVGRNEGTGIYQGGIPGAAAEKGTKVEMTGIDILRVEDGKIVECWHNSNDFSFMMQLKAVQMLPSEQTKE